MTGHNLNLANCFCKVVVNINYDNLNVFVIKTSLLILKNSYPKKIDKLKGKY